MTAREQKIHQNIAKWRSLPESERRRILYSTAVTHVANSMAMEGEPVSQEWLCKNASRTYNK